MAHPVPWAPVGDEFRMMRRKAANKGKIPVETPFQVKRNKDAKN